MKQTMTEIRENFNWDEYNASNMSPLFKAHPTHKHVWSDKDGNIVVNKIINHPKLGVTVIPRNYERKITGNRKYYKFDNQYNGHSRSTTIHRIVAETWIPNPLGLTDVDHINNDTLDNRVENLQWLSHKANIKKRDLNGHALSKKVKITNLNTQDTHVFTNGVEAAEFLGTFTSYITKLIQKGTYYKQSYLIEMVGE